MLQEYEDYSCYTQTRNIEDTMSSNDDKMTSVFKGLGIVVVIIVFAFLAYIVFNISKLVYSYSRSALLSVWTFLALAGLLFLSLVFFDYYGSSGWLGNDGWVLAGLWVAGVGSIFFSTYTLYKKKKSEVDKLIEEEAYVERAVTALNSKNSKNSVNTEKLLIGAGALYAGYTLGKKKGL